jgi:Family of unknown function (DUF5755)
MVKIAKKCPPGVFCVENLSLFLITIILLVLGFLVYINMNKSFRQNINIETQMPQQQPQSQTFGLGLNWLPSWPYTNLQRDVLLDPYSAPYRDERYLVPEVGIVPINVPTNIGATPIDTSYRQVGIITPLNGTPENNILPLMGRPLFTNRDKWQYYTITNQHNNVKLPISFKGKSALNDYGVDKIYNGDTVYVEGYGDAYKVTVYENDTIRYLPFV